MEVEACLMEPHRTKVQMVESTQHKKKWPRMDGPDGGWAWCVALSACSINFIMAGLGRMSGILYVAFIEQFEVNRKTATAPFSVRSSTRNLLGPVVGILGQQFSVRTVSIAGGIIGTLSCASCYFATDMNWITILWGGFNGIGSAMTMTLAQVVIGQHFVTHRTTASGLAFSGGCVGSFIFPILIEFLLRNYGMQGTFLILSGVIMHVIPAAMMLRKPAWMRKRSRPPSDTQEESNAAGENDKHYVHQNGIHEKCSSIDGNISEDRSQQRFYWLERDMELVARVVFSAMQSTVQSQEAAKDMESYKSAVFDILNSMYSIAKRQLQDNSSDSLPLSQKPLGPRERTCQSSRDFVQFVENLEPFTVEQEWKDQQEGQNYNDNVLKIFNEVLDAYNLYLQAETAQNHVTDIVKIKVADEGGSKSWMERLKSHIKTALTLNASPMYSLICLCRAMHFMTYVPVVTVIVDFCMDNGLPEDDGKFAIAALSAGDLVGRLCLGWITDRGYVNLPKYMFFNMLIQGAITAVIPFMPNRWSLLTMFSVFGMLEGSLFIRHPVLISNYMKEDEQSIAMGSMNFLSGLLGFGLPYYIGYFRDTLGSYNLLFHINGAISSAIGIIWLFEPYFAKRVPENGAPPEASTTAV